MVFVLSNLKLGKPLEVSRAVDAVIDKMRVDA
jgi:hypothetical protein